MLAYTIERSERLPFTLSWTGPRGGESMTVETAKEALAEYDRLNGRAAKLIVKDDRGVKLSESDLFNITNLSDGGDDA